MRHDQGSDQAGADAPRGSPNVFKLPFARKIFDIKRLREVLAQMVRRASLDRATILHQSLDAVGVLGASELLDLGLNAS